MKNIVRNRIVTVLTAATIAFTGMTVSASNAFAAPPSASFDVGAMQADGSRYIWIYRNGKLAGAGGWQANGDLLLVSDRASDGYYITAHMSNSSYARNLSSAGYPSPSDRQLGGNIAEDKTYYFWTCIGSNTAGLTCSDMWKITS